MSKYFAVASKIAGGLHDTQVRGAIRDRVLQSVRNTVMYYCNEDPAQVLRYRNHRVYSKDSVFEHVLVKTSDVITGALGQIKRGLDSAKDSR